MIRSYSIVFLSIALVTDVKWSTAIVTRNDRVWPIGNSSSVDLPQSSPYGPRYQISTNAYNYHRGVDIPADLYSNVHAIADGEIQLNGTDGGPVLIKHTNWEEDLSTDFYSYYDNVIGGASLNFKKGDQVTKGQIIAYSYKYWTFEHIHFEVRVGTIYSRGACNVWKYLPNSANNYTSFEAVLNLTTNYNNIDCQAVVNVSVPPDQLTFNRVELHILDNSDNPQKVRFYDMCGTNSNRTQDQVNNSTYLEDPHDPDSYKILISPKRFTSRFLANNDGAEYGFEFVDLPQLDGGGGKVMAKIFDVFGNSKSTGYISYTCTGTGGGTMTISPPTNTFSPLVIRNDRVWLIRKGARGTPVPPTTNPSQVVTRNDRVWPIGNSTSVDLGQSAAYGPRSSFSGSYDFNHGADILADKYSNVYAVADGVVRINGSHPSYTNPLVQIIHTDWVEHELIYTNYFHITMSKNGADPINLPTGQFVNKGQLIAYVLGTSFIDHIQFEVRVGSTYSRDACNPWKYMPNSENNCTSFEAELSLTTNYNNIDCEAVVNVSVPPNQLTFNRVELHILDNSNFPQKVRFYDMCGANSNRSTSQIESRTYMEYPYDLSSYKIIISPKYFHPQSYVNEQDAEYGFEFVDLPQLDGGGGGKVMAKIFDVFGNSLSTEYVSYNCPGRDEGTTSSQLMMTLQPTVTSQPTTTLQTIATTPPATTPLPLVTRNDRVWPIGNSDSVDLGQSVPYGPRSYYNGSYDFHHGVDILADKYSNVYAVADGVVRINGSHSNYSNHLIQIEHTNWMEDDLVYTNYIHITMSKNGTDLINLPTGQSVSKGQLIAYVLGTSNIDHIQFEVRVGSTYSRDACNPWKYMPNSENNYTSFEAELSLTTNYNNIDCEAVVNVSVPLNQLTFNRVELHIIHNSGIPQKVRFYDMCGANSNNSQIESRTYMEDPNDSSSYKIIISPKYFQNQSVQDAEYGFEFVDLPKLDGGGGKVMAKIFDVFGNSLFTEYVSYTCALTTIQQGLDGINGGNAVSFASLVNLVALILHFL